MAEEPSKADTAMHAVEAEIRRLHDVAAVRVVTVNLRRPVEVDVLAHTGTHAKHVVRDVQPVALTSFNLEVLDAANRRLSLASGDTYYD